MRAGAPSPPHAVRSGSRCRTRAGLVNGRATAGNHSQVPFGPKSVFLLTRSLEVGGAERQLVELAQGLFECGHRVTVAVFYGSGPLRADLEQAGVRVIDLRKTGRWDS